MKYALLPLFVLLLTSTQAQVSYSIIDQVTNQDTISFTIRDDANNLITGKIMPPISNDSLINLMTLCDGIETRDGINNQLYADVVREFDSKTINFLIKNGQKFVYQYNDGAQDLLKNGTGMSKIFNERLEVYTDRVFKDSILLYRYELFEKDTLYGVGVYDENFDLVFDQVIDIINKLKSNEYFHKDLFFVIDENRRLSYIIVSNKEISGSRTIKKIEMPKKHKYYFNDLPQKNIKRVVHIAT